ncbi:MAG: L,D-transpeptidase family protein [Sphingomicrobium sp.]
MSGRRHNELKRAAGAMAFFLLGGTAAAALSLASRPQHAAIAPTRPQALVSTNRIEVSAPDLRRAIAAGLINQPIKSVLNVPGRMRYGDFIWDERGIPAGRTSIRVDLKSQLISVFRSGHEIGTAVILYGADSVPTPVGKFPILAKLKNHRSATYDAPMPYTLRLTPDGVSIHASDVRWGFATHGCIGVPRDFAMKLFAATSVGDEVFIVSRS